MDGTIVPAWEPICHYQFDAWSRQLVTLIMLIAQRCQREITTILGAAEPLATRCRISRWRRRPKRVEQNISEIPPAELLPALPVKLWFQVLRSIPVTARTAAKTIAGDGWAGSCTDGPVKVATFRFPSGVCVGPANTIFVADSGVNLPTSRVTFAHVSPFLAVGRSCSPCLPLFLWLTSIIATATGGNKIRRVSNSRAPEGTMVETIAGEGDEGYRDGVGNLAMFNWPSDIAIGKNGLWVTDQANFRVRYVACRSDASITQAIATECIVQTVCGTDSWGKEDGSSDEAQFRSLGGIAVRPRDNGSLIVADTGNHTIREVLLHSGAGNGIEVRTLAGVSGTKGWVDGSAIEAQFNSPAGVAVCKDESVIVADTANHIIRRIAPDGTVTTLAGSGTPALTDGMASKACFFSPTDVAISTNGSIVVCDTGNHAIRLISACGCKVTTLAGGFQRGLRRCEPAEAALFNRPTGVDIDSNGAVIVADTGNRGIVRVSVVSYTFRGSTK